MLPGPRPQRSPGASRRIGPRGPRPAPSSSAAAVASVGWRRRRSARHVLSFQTATPACSASRAADSRPATTPTAARRLRHRPGALRPPTPRYSLPSLASAPPLPALRPGQLSSGVRWFILPLSSALLLPSAACSIFPRGLPSRACLPKCVRSCGKCAIAGQLSRSSPRRRPWLLIRLPCALGWLRMHPSRRPRYRLFWAAWMGPEKRMTCRCLRRSWRHRNRLLQRARAK